MNRGLQIWLHKTLIDELESCELFVDYLDSNTSIPYYFSILSFQKNDNTKQNY